MSIYLLAYTHVIYTHSNFIIICINFWQEDIKRKTEKNLTSEGSSYFQNFNGLSFLFNKLLHLNINNSTVLLMAQIVIEHMHCMCKALV